MSTRENIIANVVTVLGAIATSGGYNNNLSGRVHRALKHWDECSEFPQVFVVDGRENKKFLTNLEATAELEIIIRAYEYHVSDASERLNKLLEDVEKALCADTARGGYAVMTEPVSVETDEGWLTPHGIFEFRWKVTYDYTIGTP